MTLPYSPTRVPVVPVHSPIPPYGALVPPNAPSSHELTDPSFCSLVAKRCALVLRAALPFDEFLEQRLLLIEAMTKFCGTAALATTPALAAIGLAVMAERCASQDPASGVRLRPGSVAVRLTSRHFGCRSEACSSAKRGNSVSTKRAMRAAAPGSSLSLAAESTAGGDGLHLTAAFDQIGIVGSLDPGRQIGRFRFR